MSVEPRPASTTSAPWEVAPRANAAASGPDDSRMSCAVTTASAPVTRTNAAPAASATASSSSSGTTPRMSYALKILARSPTPAPLYASDDRKSAGQPSLPGSAAAARAGAGRGRDRGHSCGRIIPAAGSLLRLGARRFGAQHAQVPAAADLGALADGLLPGGRRGAGGLADGVGERLQVVGARLGLLLDGEPDQ